MTLGEIGSALFFSALIFPPIAVIAVAGGRHRFGRPVALAIAAAASLSLSLWLVLDSTHGWSRHPQEDPAQSAPARQSACERYPSIYGC